MSSRLLYLDAARGVLMLLGVLLHAARIYDPVTDWLLHDSESSVFFRYLTEIIHFFRMPAFFVVSGLFCAMALRRYGPGKFLWRRLTRILLPLFVTALVLNVPVAWFLFHAVGRDEFLPGSVSFWWDGRWVLHLWFLWFLLLFVLTTPLVLATRTWRVLVASQSQRLGIVLFPLAFATVMMLPETFSSLNQRVAFLGYPHDWLRLGVFFYFGLMLGERPDLQLAFSRHSVLNTVLAVLLIVLCFYRFDFPGEWWWQRWFIELLHGVGIFAAIHLVVAAFSRWCQRDRAVLRYLADTSYSVYLFHHAIVPVLGWLLIGFTLPLLLKYLLVVAGAIAISLWLHHRLVRPFALTRLLFNGELPRRHNKTLRA